MNAARLSKRQLARDYFNEAQECNDEFHRLKDSGASLEEQRLVKQRKDECIITAVDCDPKLFEFYEDGMYGDMITVECRGLGKLHFPQRSAYLLERFSCGV